jgi:pimeloyl-ACP methyl ester carboxylesterase
MGAAEAAALAAAVPDGRVATVAGAGHYPFLDDPAGFVGLAKGFLA